jgi:hypothetical protein
VAHIRCLELFARQGDVNLTEQLCQRLPHYISPTIAADELSSAQPRHVIERLIDHEQHPALRQIEAEVAQIRGPGRPG